MYSYQNELLEVFVKVRMKVSMRIFKTIDQIIISAQENYQCLNKLLFELNLFVKYALSAIAMVTTVMNSILAICLELSIAVIHIDIC